MTFSERCAELAGHRVSLIMAGIGLTHKPPAIEVTIAQVGEGYIETDGGLIVRFEAFQAIVHADACPCRPQLALPGNAKRPRALS